MGNPVEAALDKLAAYYWKRATIALSRQNEAAAEGRTKAANLWHRRYLRYQRLFNLCVR